MMAPGVRPVGTAGMMRPMGATGVMRPMMQGTMQPMMKAGQPAARSIPQSGSNQQQPQSASNQQAGQNAIATAGAKAVQLVKARAQPQMLNSMVMRTGLQAAPQLGRALAPPGLRIAAKSAPVARPPLLLAAKAGPIGQLRPPSQITFAGGMQAMDPEKKKKAMALMARMQGGAAGNYSLFFFDIIMHFGCVPFFTILWEAIIIGAC